MQTSLWALAAVATALACHSNFLLYLLASDTTVRLEAVKGTVRRGLFVSRGLGDAHASANSPGLRPAHAGLDPNALHSQPGGLLLLLRRRLPLDFRRRCHVSQGGASAWQGRARLHQHHAITFRPMLCRYQLKHEEGADGFVSLRR